MTENEDSLLSRQAEGPEYDRGIAEPEPKTNRRKMKIAFIAIIFLSLGALFYNSIYTGYWTNLDKRAEDVREQIRLGFENKSEREIELQRYLSQNIATSTPYTEISGNRAGWLKKFIDVESRLTATREKLLSAVEKRNYLAIINYANEASPIILERIKLLSEEPMQ